MFKMKNDVMLGIWLLIFLIVKVLNDVNSDVFDVVI